MKNDNLDKLICPDLTELVNKNFEQFNNLCLNYYANIHSAYLNTFKTFFDLGRYPKIKTQIKP